ncbi:hypothetical protein RRG08_060664 [Elysia crispata]|uniref:Uncharacterized protein n=1 Tax=Elysia crispata TaxID=231223 RepID=A0AAE1AT98_9GAST|nr:hypothetical protein RRG08_060664 [Elysia crispata]
MKIEAMLGVSVEWTFRPSELKFNALSSLWWLELSAAFILFCFLIMATGPRISNVFRYGHQKYCMIAIDRSGGRAQKMETSPQPYKVISNESNLKVDDNGFGCERQFK